MTKPPDGFLEPKTFRFLSFLIIFLSEMRFAGGGTGKDLLNFGFMDDRFYYPGDKLSLVNSSLRIDDMLLFTDIPSRLMKTK